MMERSVLEPYSSLLKTTIRTRSFISSKESQSMVKEVNLTVRKNLIKRLMMTRMEKMTSKSNSPSKLHTLFTRRIGFLSPQSSFFSSPLSSSFWLTWSLSQSMMGACLRRWLRALRVSRLWSAGSSALSSCTRLWQMRATKAWTWWSTLQTTIGDSEIGCGPTSLASANSPSWSPAKPLTWSYCRQTTACLTSLWIS